MIDLHMHTLHSDGELIPAELVQRAKTAGYRALAITDHADQSNLESVVLRSIRAARELTAGSGILVLSGVEITHVPPRQIPELVRFARDLGAECVVVHGETPVEPVPRGTNRAAIAAGVDVLAHPGLITPEECRDARRQGVALEITARGGHSLGNGHVALLARAAGCPMVVDSDTHAPRDLYTPELMRSVVLGAGLPASALAQCQAYAWSFCQRALKRRTRPRKLAPAGPIKTPKDKAHG